MALNLRSAVRALIIDDDDHVLLVRFVFPSGVEAWALPGGGLEDGEDPLDGLRRELHEELGATDLEIGPHIWNREHIIPMYTGHDGQVDQIHLVHTPRFDPEPALGWDQMRAEFVHEFRWWSIDDVISATHLRFAPKLLGEMTASLLADGPPDSPIDTGV